MGVEGPMTAQALGRSPYDEGLVEGCGEELDHDPKQQYDARGRPVNPETKRMNKEIIRSHNEVMLVVGVAEENSNPDQEAKLQALHEQDEQRISNRIFLASANMLDAVGVFGFHRLRQRILVYNRFSEMPFWLLYKRARSDFSPTRYLLPGSVVDIFVKYIQLFVIPHIYMQEGLDLVRPYIINGIWPYAKVHLELYAAMQRLGLVPNTHWLPDITFFIPFHKESPLSFPSIPRNLNPSSCLGWFGQLFIANAPFILFWAAQRASQTWDLFLQVEILLRLPNSGRSTFFREPSIASSSTPPLNARPPNAGDGQDVSTAREEGPMEMLDMDHEHLETRAVNSGDGRPNDSSTLSEGYNTDEEENQALAAPLISIDVESSESANISQGLYSAELRPSYGPNYRPTTPVVMYRSTPLAQLPVIMATNILREATMRIFLAPYEAMTLRLVASSFCLQRGLPFCDDIRPMRLFGGLNWTFTVNFLGSELLHLAICGDIWAVWIAISHSLQMSDEEWKAQNGHI